MDASDATTMTVDHAGEFSSRCCNSANAIRSGPLPGLESSDSEGWDFEPLSPSSTDSSEIPEAILEESSDDDHRSKHCQQVIRPALSGGGEADCSGENFASQQPATINKPLVISAWTSAWTAGPATTSRDTLAGSGTGDATTGGLATGAALTPVRRARVRGTVLLPTSSRGPSSDEPTSLRRSTTAPLIRPTTAPSWRSGFCLPRWGHAAEGALAAERQRHEQELERQAKEDVDRQAILKALDDDRAVLATSYKQAQAELTRVQAELARVQAELSRRTAEVWDLRDTQDVLQQQLNRLPSRLPICVCCLDAHATMAPVPCGHLALCEACVRQLETFICPVCRQPSECMIHIFTP